MRAVGTLRDAGVPVLVLKGAATARLDHVRVEDRPYRDVDLLVPVDRLVDSLAALTSHGFDHLVSHPYRTLRRFHSETLVDRTSGLELDLHHRFAKIGRPPRTVWSETEPFELGGATLLAPAPHWRLVNVVLNEFQNPPGGRKDAAVDDALRLLRRPDLDLAGARRAAAECGLALTFHRGVERWCREAGVPLPAGWGPPPVATWADRRLASRIGTDEPIPGYDELLLGLAFEPGWWSRAGYLAEILWPRPEFRALEGRSVAGQLRHVVREALGRPGDARRRPPVRAQRR